MQVAIDFICDHGMPKPWATCMDCMMAPPDERPVPPPEVAKSAAKKVTKKKAAKPAKAPGKKRAPAAPRAGRLPRTQSDPLPELIGDKDMAYEIPESDFRYFTGGPESDWLPLSQMPKELRAGGYVYLQVDSYLVARAQVSGVGFRERRWDHAAPDAATDLGPGATLELRGGWGGASIDLGPEGDTAITGFRYLVEDPDGTVGVAPPPPPR